MFRSVGGLLYFLAGLYVAYINAYVSFVDLRAVISLILAVLLWPLVLLGVNLHLGAL